ncbi:MAG: Hpt domain-containing protein [Gammaproteobacteria bacterium]|nr:Hpt domain-containing protein [Gammaproteobacteria bacterium]MCH9744762.1 Hpt domain-containing protein [Gammaproteobacteria bacterium]
MANKSFDWELTLKQCNSKQDLAKDLVDMLRGDLPKTQRAIQAALKKQDTQNIYEEIHKLHGSCAYCGMPKLKKLIVALENEIKQNKISNLNASVKAIDKEIEQVKKELAVEHA